MALSYSKFTADGVNNVYPLVFPFLDKSHIKGQVDGEEVNLSVDTYYKRVTVTPFPKAGSLVVIRRRTPRDRVYSNFTGGNPFGQVNVNNSFLWQLYISQEIAEGDVSDEFFTSNDLDMGGHRIFNLGKPKTDTDAVRVKDLDAAIDNLGDMAGSSISELPPVDKVAGRRWTRCSDMKSFIWYVDNDGAQWVEDNPSMGAKRNEQRIPTTVAIVATGAYAVGEYLELTDRAGAKFNVVAGGTPNGYDIINAGNGNTATYNNIRYAVLQHLGLSDDKTASENGGVFLAAEKYRDIYIEPCAISTDYISRLYSNSNGLGVRSITGGSGQFSTQINYTGTESAIRASDKTALTGGSVNVRLTNFYLNFNGTDPDVVGIDLTRMRYTTVSGVFVSRFKDNVLLSESWGSKFYDMSNYDATGSGVKGLTENNGIEFHGPQLYRNAIAWDIANAPQLSVIGGITERNAVAIRCNNVGTLSFSDHYFEANTTLANLEWLIGTVSLNSCRIKSQVGLSTSLFNCEMGDPNRNGKLVVRSCVLYDVPATGKALVVTQGVLMVEWYDNSYVNWSHNQLRGILTTRYDKLASNEAIQVVVMEARYNQKSPPKLYRSNSGVVSLLLNFSMSSEVQNLQINPTDALVIKPPTFLSYVGISDSSAVGELTSIRVNSVGNIFAYFTTGVSSTSNQSVMVEFNA